MKTIIFTIMFGFCASASAAGGTLVYEASSSSNAVASVALSSTTPTLISKSPATSVTLGQPPIQWYSLTMYNVAASSAVYAWGHSATTAPEMGLTCATGAPIGYGTVQSPWHTTEQFINTFLWGMSCKDNETVTLKVVYRGR